jgi:hypothetical protein
VWLLGVVPATFFQERWLACLEQHFVLLELLQHLRVLEQLPALVLLSVLDCWFY